VEVLEFLEQGPVRRIERTGRRPVGLVEGGIGPIADEIGEEPVRFAVQFVEPLAFLRVGFKADNPRLVRAQQRRIRLRAGTQRHRADVDDIDPADVRDQVD
jgi:hypothetical protein